jgi:hypothetical protein
MTRAILFRFHDHIELCKERIAHLRKLNPGVQIFGLFGGERAAFERASSLDLDHHYMIPFDDPYYKWLHGDLCIRQWYHDVGSDFSFDLLHIVEWDLLLCEPLDVLFGACTDGVALADLEPMQPRIDRGWYWVTGPRGAEEWKRLQAFCVAQFAWNDAPLGSVFPGAMLSRDFLEQYASIAVPSYCNDEVRVPIFAQSFGLPVHRLPVEIGETFRCEKKEIAPDVIRQAYAKGERIFHPVYTSIEL